jgi:hypothetical protein
LLWPCNTRRQAIRFRRTIREAVAQYCFRAGFSARLTVLALQAHVRASGRRSFSVSLGNLVGALRKNGFSVRELSTTNCDEQCRRVIFQLTVRRVA